MKINSVSVVSVEGFEGLDFSFKNPSIDLHVNNSAVLNKSSSGVFLKNGHKRVVSLYLCHRTESGVLVWDGLIVLEVVLSYNWLSWINRFSDVVNMNPSHVYRSIEQDVLSFDNDKIIALWNSVLVYVIRLKIGQDSVLSYYIKNANLDMLKLIENLTTKTSDMLDYYKN